MAEITRTNHCVPQWYQKGFLPYGILVWCADRLQAVKWRNYKVHFYQQDTMI
jgi:hypothetical protein